MIIYFILLYMKLLHYSMHIFLSVVTSEKWTIHSLTMCDVVNVEAHLSCSGQPQLQTASNGLVNSPGFDFDNGTYPNNAYCQWLIVAPRGKVRLVSTFCVPRF